MKRFLRWLGGGLTALLLGLGSAWWAVAGTDANPVRNGVWSYNPRVGSAAADPYTRARVVTAGPLALSRSEAIYFIATHDAASRELLCNRRYRLEGGELDARWWSITLYDEEGFLVPNTENRYSYNSANLARNPDGRFTLHLAPERQPGNWLPTGKGESFFLALRLYNPSPELRAHLTTVALPRLIDETGGA